LVATYTSAFVSGLPIAFRTLAGILSLPSVF
jgi:hypothetical protein